MNIKTFAQQSRKILMEGVAQKVLFWGFDNKGDNQHEPEAIEGGYMFRGEVYDDPTVLSRWKALKSAISTKGIKVVMEEAAYTWFNRMMAIRILSKSGYDMSQLEYEGDNKTPVILQRARRGQYSFLSPDEQSRLQQVIPDYQKEKEAFAILLVGYCHSHTLLQSVFGGIDDYTELLLPGNILAQTGFIHLLNTTDAISDEEYQKVELIGWLYQFYISDRKDEVFASFKKKKKAEAKDIPAATQIFTPNWIVKYMVENTVGKLWLDLNPQSEIKEKMEYLVESPNREYGDPIISEIVELKLMDPAVGSGHILVEGFDLLYEMYMEEYYSPEEAVQSILQHNLFGLDIDKRAAQLARFAVLLKAAKKHSDILKKGLLPHIYAMPEPRPFSRQEVLDFLGAEGNQYEDALFNALKRMQDAQNLGSIMEFGLSIESRAYILQRLNILKEENYRSFEIEALLPAITPYIQIVTLLTQRYQAVAANPPYMGQKSMNSILKSYVNKHFPLSKADLYAVFMEVCLSLNSSNGFMGMINQHSWMFLSTYVKLREDVLSKFSIQSMLHLGPRTFEELSGEVVQSTAFVIEKGKKKQEGIYFRLVDFRNNNQKENNFKRGENKYAEIAQSNFSLLPGSPIAYWISDRVVELLNNQTKISKYSNARIGLATGRNDYYLRYWHETSYNNIDWTSKSRIEAKLNGKKWFRYNKGGEIRRWYGNQTFVINWENDGAELLNTLHPSGKRIWAHNFNLEYIFKESISWTDITTKGLALRFYPAGSLFDSSGTSAFFEDKKIMLYALGFTNTKFVNALAKVFNPTFHFTPGDYSRLPFIYDRNEAQIVIEFVERCINISQRDWDAHEVSWCFKSNPLCTSESTLKEAYQTWLKKVTNDFFQLHEIEVELNKIFIKLYKLEEEITPQIPLKDITILQEELNYKALDKMEDTFKKEGKEAVELPIKNDLVIKQLISYAIGVFMGRYRLDKPGLNIAHPNPTDEEIASYTVSFSSQTEEAESSYHKTAGSTIVEKAPTVVEIDQDAIIPLMGSDCQFPDDAVQRVKKFLEIVWGTDTLTQNLNFLQECLDEDLEKYLVKQFWKDHCRMYSKKPIYWLFSSPSGAFQILVYMHRMNAFTVEKIRSNYLMEHLKSLRFQIEQMENSAQTFTKIEAKLLDKLRSNLQECEAYDTQLKDVADRQIVFDLDDGVTANYALFEGVVAPIK